MTEIDVYEPLVVKEQIITSASEAAVMILRIARWAPRRTWRYGF
jgi:chaperonin GroEL (HSP60 family)